MTNKDGQPICPSGDCSICGRLETDECLCTEVTTITICECGNCKHFDYDFNYCNLLNAGVDGEDFYCKRWERRDVN